MDHKEYIKSEFYNKLLCRACLSSDRTLSPVGSYLEIYQNICDKTSCLLFQYDESEINLCWECISALKNIKLFKEKVVNAQTILRYCIFDQDQENFPICLSNLTVTEINYEGTVSLLDHELKHKTETETEHEIEIEHETETEFDHKTETEYEIEVKTETVKNEIGHETENKPIDEQEHEIATENDSDVTQNDFTHLEDLKSKSDTLHKDIKKLKKEKKAQAETLEKKERKQNYRTFTNSTKKMLRRVKIVENEVHAWRERVRNSDYFKNLKSKCEKCVVRYSSTALKAHNSACHDKSLGQYSCNFCQSFFWSKDILAVHVEKHYLLYECKVCGFQCYTKEGFYTHMRGHKRTVQCLECGASHSTTFQFFEHYKAMHTVFTCDLCGKTYHAKDSLVRHFRNSHNVHCEICKTQYSKNRHLKKHIQLKHTSAPTEDAFCVTCNKQFDNVHVYRQHVYTSAAHAPERSHRKNSNFPCPDCGKVYKRKDAMTNHHKLVHTRRTKYSCKEHDKLYVKRTSYLRHIRHVHEGREKEKNKICSVCGRGFHGNQILKNHMRTHTGERPYACAHCDARFAQRTAMLTHVKHIHFKVRRNGDNQPPLVG